MASPLRVVRELDALRIYFGEALHLHLPTRDLAFQSWFEYGKVSFVIEYTLHTGAVVVSEYDNEQAWLDILKRLDEVFSRQATKNLRS